MKLVSGEALTRYPPQTHARAPSPTHTRTRLFGLRSIPIRNQADNVVNSNYGTPLAGADVPLMFMLVFLASKALASVDATKGYLL